MKLQSYLRLLFHCSFIFFCLSDFCFHLWRKSRKRENSKRHWKWLINCNFHCLFYTFFHFWVSTEVRIVYPVFCFYSRFLFSFDEKNRNSFYVLFCKLSKVSWASINPCEKINSHCSVKVNFRVPSSCEKLLNLSLNKSFDTATKRLKERSRKRGK